MTRIWHDASGSKVSKFGDSMTGPLSFDYAPADVTLAGGGAVIIGQTTSQNIAIDNNEIESRNNGSIANLFIQASSGNTRFGGSSVPTEILDVTGNIQASGSVKVDDIVQKTAATGVTVEGVLIKANVITNSGAGTILSLSASDNSTLSIYNIFGVAITANDTYLAFQGNGSTIGSIAGTATSGLIAYNTFTGSHYTKVVDDIDNKIEQIEIEPNVLLEIVNDDNNQSHLFKTRICKTKGSKRAIGVYGGRNKDGMDMVLSIGTGFIWVANKGVDVSTGDYLISSDVEGCSELQTDEKIRWMPDNVYRNSTVAKSTNNIKWKEGENKRLVSCIYLGG